MLIGEGMGEWVGGWVSELTKGLVGEGWRARECERSWMRVCVDSESVIRV